MSPISDDALTAVSPTKKKLAAMAATPPVPVSLTRRQEDVEEEKLQQRLRNLERQKRDQLDQNKRREEEEKEEEEKRNKNSVTKSKSETAAVEAKLTTAADTETDLEKEIEDLEQQQLEDDSWLRTEIGQLRSELNDLKAMVKSMVVSKKKNNKSKEEEEGGGKKTLTALDIISREVRTTLIAKNLYEETTETTLLRYTLTKVRGSWSPTRWE